MSFNTQCTDVTNSNSVNNQTEFCISYNDKEEEYYVKINGEIQKLLPSFTKEGGNYTFYTKTNLCIEIDFKEMIVREKYIDCFKGNNPMYTTVSYKINHYKKS